MTVSNLLRVTLHWTGYGEEGDISGWFAGAPSLYSDTDLSAALAAIDNALATGTTPSSWTKLQALITSAQSYDSLSIYQYAAAPGPSSVVAHRVPSPARAGTGVETCPLQTAAVVSVGTGSASRRKRGRMYMPGHCLSVGNGGLFSATGRDNAWNAGVGFLADTLTALRATLAGGDPIRHVVFSRVGGLVTPSTALTVDNKPDIQRRRANKLQPTSVSAVGHVNPTS